MYTAVMAAKHMVLVAGNIGAGKTSLVTKLGETLGWRTGFETVETNPYLGKFYGDMRTWAFHLQVFLLGQRSNQHIEAYRDAQSAILDRSIYEDYHIFARALHSLGNLSRDDLNNYARVYELVVASLPKPDLLIMLKAPVDALLARIRARGREMETGISAEYLRLLDGYYDEWLDGFDLCPVLTISSGDLDYVNDPQDLEVVIKTIEAKLSGRDELVFDE